MVDKLTLGQVDPQHLLPSPSSSRVGALDPFKAALPGIEMACQLKTVVTEKRGVRD